MGWFQRHDAEIRTFGEVHGGDGSIQISRFFHDRLTLPIHVQLWELEPGTSEGDHTHPGGDPADNWEELYYVLSGTGTITIDGARQAIGPGDAVLVPTDIHHGLYDTGDQPLRILLIFGRPPAG